MVVLLWLLLHALAASTDNTKTAAPARLVLLDTGAKVVGPDYRSKRASAFRSLSGCA